MSVLQEEIKESLNLIYKQMVKIERQITTQQEEVERYMKQKPLEREAVTLLAAHIRSSKISVTLMREDFNKLYRLMVTGTVGMRRM